MGNSGDPGRRFSKTNPKKKEKQNKKKEKKNLELIIISVPQFINASSRRALRSQSSSYLLRALMYLLNLELLEAAAAAAAVAAETYM